MAKSNRCLVIDMMALRAFALFSVLLIGVAYAAGIALAQTDDPITTEPLTEPAAEPAKPKKKSKDTSDLEARVQQLERQILDMQVVIGTLESMARGGGSTGGASSDQDARIEALETQLQALTAEVRSLGGGAVSSTSVPAAPATAATDAGDFEATTPDEVIGDGSDLTLDPNAAPAGDQIGDLIGDGGATEPTVSAEAGAAPPAGTDVAASDLGTLDGTEPAAPATGETDVAALQPGSTPEQVYEEAYGHLLQQDFVAAEAGFKALLKQYPKSKLAGNAQYWLGETHYVRGNYKAAADAFLTGYKNFRKGQKAPDSLMKLAMSLSRLGEKDAACSAFAALENDFPKVQAQLRRKAEAERARAGC